MNAWWIIGLLLIGVGVLFWPQIGLVARWRHARELAERSQREDVLKHLLKCEANGRQASLDTIAGTLHISTGDAADLVQDLEERELVSHEDSRLRLEASGREMALHIVRAHRLWESYLAEQTGVAETEWHQRAERQEHLLTPQETDALSAKLGNPTHDPHGDVIPGRQENLPADEGQPLGALPVEARAVITHIEDEPPTIYAQLCAQGLRPGMRITVLEKAPQRVRFWADGNEHVLAPVLANNITVTALTEAQVVAEEKFLNQLQRGERAKVLGLAPACRGAERRRLLDLGFVAGTPVEIEIASPLGDPVGYRVRGTVIALRREQAGLIRITPEEVVAA
ncbi:MAG: FeoA domain-containing protein [Verrucomicrobiota bacterium]